MAEVYYNGVLNEDLGSGMLTFSDVPNILKIEASNTGENARFEIQFEGNIRQTVTGDSQYYITFLGETISNVMDASAANNKHFYCDDDEDGTAMSVTRALRCCSRIAADFNVIHAGPYVILKAKTIGQKWANTPVPFSTNMTNFTTASGTDGNYNSTFYNSKIDVDVYSGSTSDENNYVTTLQKNFYGNECSFNMSPVLATLSDFGKSSLYMLSISMTSEIGRWQTVGSVITASTTVGYHANQSDKYKHIGSAQMLLNKNRGDNNTMTLYTYSNTIPYTILSTTNMWPVQVKGYDSANVQIYTASTTQTNANGNSRIADASITIPQTAFTSLYYVDIIVGEQTTRFNVIKPLKATEYYQRILWRNEYGGISFFDFTGARTETDDVDIETYEKNIFDYYDTTEFERKKIYKNDYEKQVSLTSHLMETDGKWIFNSLMRSKRVWTEINGKTYYIIPKAIEVNEDSTYNNIYTAKLTYTYSDI